MAHTPDSEVEVKICIAKISAENERCEMTVCETESMIRLPVGERRVETNED